MNPNKNDFLDDDCPICRAMKDADQEGRELSMEELKDSFKKARDQGAVVGGTWFEEDEE